MTRILVTGADGFVGAHLSPRLAARGHAVRAAVRTRGAHSQSAAIEVCVSGDLELTPDWLAMLQGVEVVIHLAGRAHVIHETTLDPLAAFRRANVVPTLELFHACQNAGVARLVFVSSIGVLGTETGPRAFSEDDTPRPTEAYARSKWEAESALSALAQQSATELVIVRPTLVCGAHASGNFDRLIRLLKRQLPLPLGLVSGSRNFVGVRNLCDLLELCATHPAAAQRTFLAADPEVLTTPQLLATLAQALNVKLRLVPCPPSLLKLGGRLTGREREVRRLTESLLVDASLAQRELAWRHDVPLVDELTAMARASAT